MKVAFLRFAVAICFLFSTQTVKAQAVITEYLDVKKSFNINLNDKKVIQSMLTKGVLDIEWNEEKRTLAVSYDPKQTKIEEIVPTINRILGSNADISINNKTLGQYTHIR